MQLTGIFVYPIKGTSAMSPDEARVEPRGLAGDRRWMVVDEQDQFLQQRKIPQMALLRAEFEGAGGLRIHAPGQPPLDVAEPAGSDRRQVTVWGDSVLAADAGDAASEWLTRALGAPCRLVFMDAFARRSLPPPETTGRDPADGGVSGEVSFADAMPLLLASEASLADLNRKLDQPVPMSRFRPNLVVGGAADWAEDEWRQVRIGDVEFDVAYPCARCVVTTIDQLTAVKDDRGEPLKTLTTFRENEWGVCFGMNLVPRGAGMVRLNDPVVVLR